MSLPGLFAKMARSLGDVAHGDVGGAERSDAVGRIVLVASAALGLLAILSWSLGHIANTQAPPLFGMPPVTAVAIIISGLLVQRSNNSRTRRSSWIGLGLVAGLAALSIGEYVAGWQLPIDLAPAGPATVPYPGRMSPMAAVAFLLVAAAIADRLRHGGRRRNAVIGAAAMAVAALNLLNVLYEAIGPEVLSGANRMSLDATLGVLTIGVGLVALAPTGLGRIVSSRGLDGMLGRRLVLAALTIPTTIGWVRLAGERMGLYDAGYGVSLTVLSTIALFLFVIWWTASTVGRTDARRRAAERSLRIASDELERSNRELQDFAAIASHDLQEPLRKVRAFGDRLKEGHAAQLGEQGSDYLARMTDSAARMQDLIDDLLAYSRVQTVNARLGPIDLNSIMHDVLNDLEQRVAEHGGLVEVSDLPTLVGDPMQMRQLLQNLVGNALKFRRPAVAPQVRVSARRMVSASADAEVFWEVSVSDDGIGFDQGDAERIFAPFQRLHGRAEYEGTGIGLAICRRIVQRHGGVLSAVGRPGQGATFTFKLPEAISDHPLEEP